MPAWLGNGLTTLAIGMGTVMVTLLLLWQVVALFGRAAARLQGRLVRPAVASGGGAPGLPGAGEGGPPEPVVVVAGSGEAPGRPTTPASSRDGAPGRRDTARLAAIAAAITAYVQAEAAAGRGAPEPFRVTAVRSLGRPGTGAAGQGNLGWAQAGRMETMLARQQLGTRKGHSPR